MRIVHHATRHNTPIHNILSTAPQLSISQEALCALRTMPLDTTHPSTVFYQLLLN
jgi:hypothetical protein